MEDPIFQMGTVRLLGNTEVAKFLHQAVFRDKKPICGTQGIQNGYPGARGLVIASLSLFTLCTGGLNQLTPQAHNLQVYHRRF